ncbi:uncharacterized protein LY79DRAFT_584326 [Colletotrichum navitas]|uniref:Uncharacterized protein n=1 Tax=Colletotrichum navitas TaxID=681940 RepID=A0AAD8PMQ6_9PEZI|nr:uncharacterized protein LY79DRAFT_584326 [Colletotrichum navitas]KAK1569993.1 hypothetical protein LY79DRAFT_584326 [Colletotrichum navitas]
MPREARPALTAGIVTELVLGGLATAAVVLVLRMHSLAIVAQGQTGRFSRQRPSSAKVQKPVIVCPAYSDLCYAQYQRQLPHVRPTPKGARASSPVSIDSYVA